MTRYFIVPSSYRISVDQGKTLSLITCYHLGSTSERLIIEARQENIYPISIQGETKDQSKTPYAILLMGIFLVGGLSISYFIR